MNERKIVKGFYDIVRRTIFACKVAGYLPIEGLLREQGQLTRCVWISKYSIYYGFTMILLIFFWIIHFHYIMHAGLQDFGGFLFRCSAVMLSVCLMRFCFTWKKMIRDIEDAERLLPSFQKRVIRNINRIMFFVMMFGIVNHIFHLLFTVRLVKNFIKDRPLTLELYYNIYYKWFFNNVSFNYFTAFLLQISKFQISFAYLYNDCLVILVTLYLICRFRKFNRLMRIRQTMCERNRKMLWMDLQAHYTRLSRLVKIIDSYFNPFVFLSFMSNLMFIWKNIYDTMQMKEWAFIKYEWVMILFSITKTLFLAFKISSVSYLTAHLHTLSREPLKLLHTLPDTAYTPEVQCFMDQIYHTNISLSGFGLFHITRETILSMVSTLITYELVLLQLPGTITK